MMELLDCARPSDQNIVIAAHRADGRWPAGLVELTATTAAVNDPAAHRLSWWHPTPFLAAIAQIIMLRSERRPLWQAEQARAPKLSIASAGAGPGLRQRNNARESVGLCGL